MAMRAFRCKMSNIFLRHFLKMEIQLIIKRFARGVVLAVVAVTSMLMTTAASSYGAKPHSYCVVDVSKAAAPKHCFTTFAASISFATNGRVHLSNAATARNVSAKELATASPSDITPDTTYVLSIFFQYTNYGGDTLTSTGTGVCGYWQMSSMPSGWNDKPSSLRNYSGCAATLFWDVGFGQPKYDTGVDASVPSFSNFDNKTSSVKWCPHLGC